jgi:hypothetical protein
MQNKTVMIIAISIVILFILSGVFFFLSKKNTSEPIPASTPTPFVEIPTQVPRQNPSSSQLTPYQSPSIVLTPPSFTGVLEMTLPPQEKAAVDQEFNLKNTVPIKMASFTVDFDYAGDIFVVKLTDQTKGKTDFNDWLHTNYPAIPQNRFKVE